MTEGKNAIRYWLNFVLFFKVRKDITFECTLFNWHSQQPDESAKMFISCFYSLAENCTYRDLRDEMICDHIVVGNRDSMLLDLLQLDSDLTLEKGKTLLWQCEAVHEQQSILRGGALKQKLAIKSVKCKSSWRGTVSHKTPVKGKKQSPRSSPHQPATYMCAAEKNHTTESCVQPEKQCVIPLKGRTLQFSVLSKSVGNIAVLPPNAKYGDMKYLNTGGHEDSKTSWSIKIMMGKKCHWKLTLEQR